MNRPKLLDLFSGAGGAARGYQKAGFYVVGVDIKPQPHYCGDEFHQADALTYPLEGFDAYHASPPCQGYSIMNNLPWLKSKQYPLLILPMMEILEATGKPYVLENVMGARHGAKGLKKRNLQEHGLKAGYLCGTMFGLPFYRHRLFATNWLWLAPGHPKHLGVIRRGPLFGPNGGRLSQVVFSDAEDKRGKASWPNRQGQESGAGLTLRPGYEHVPFSLSTLSNWQNGAQGNGVGIGHARGWRMAAEAMGIDWMIRDELTQAIPPVYTEYIGRQLINVLVGSVWRR